MGSFRSWDPRWQVWWWPSTFRWSLNSCGWRRYPLGEWVRVVMLATVPTMSQEPLKSWQARRGDRLSGRLPECPEAPLTRNALLAAHGVSLFSAQGGGGRVDTLGSRASARCAMRGSACSISAVSRTTEATSAPKCVKLSRPKCDCRRSVHARRDVALTTHALSRAIEASFPSVPQARAGAVRSHRENAIIRSSFR
jgi:hypothetical protein